MAAEKLRELFTQTHWLSDGTDTVWNFTFSDGYLQRAFVKAYQETPAGERFPVVITDADFIGPFQVQITPAIAAGNKFVIYRDTTKAAPLVNFADGARVSEVALDTVARQAVHITAEMVDSVTLITVDGTGLIPLIDANTTTGNASYQITPPPSYSGIIYRVNVDQDTTVTLGIPDTMPDGFRVILEFVILAADCTVTLENVRGGPFGTYAVSPDINVLDRLGLIYHKPSLKWDIVALANGY